jgi:ABC-type glycerol-3-phosphate transport system substrate-binding protein
MRLLHACVTVLALATAPAALAGTLVINANTSDPAPRAAWNSVVQEFEQAHPEIEVKFNIYDHESYKKASATGSPALRPTWCSGTSATGCGNS